MADDLFRDAGPLAAVYDAVDWASGPLGPVQDWSPALRFAVDFMLNTRFACTLIWGPEHVLVYNQPYVELAAGKHPRALGRTVEEVFPEAMDAIGPLIDSVFAGNGATWVQDSYLPLDRSGFTEECYFTYSYSPVRGPDGEVEGIIDVAYETTAQVIVARRAHLLADLGDVLVDVDDIDSLRWATLAALSRDRADLPMVDLVLWERDGPRLPPADIDSLTPDPDGVVRIPLRATRPNAPAGRLEVETSRALRFDEGYREFLFLLAAAISRALDRIGSIRAERSLSAALQRSLLSEPVDPEGAAIAVRYLPASDVAQVGGDWYDAFPSPDRGFTVVVGDVAGHDQESAAAMGQLRNLTRGIAFASGAMPAEVLTGLDEALAGFGLEVTATALVARCHNRAGGGLSVTWSSAGHPPPVVDDAEGTARALEYGDLLLGLDAGSDRTDHQVDLGPGEHLLLFTDGLVERRGADIDHGLDELVESISGQVWDSPDKLCDHVLSGLHDALDDDVALLVVRAEGD